MGTSTFLIGISIRNILKQTRSLYDFRFKVMAQRVGFMFSVTLTLTFDLCSIFVTCTGHDVLEFHNNLSSING